MLILKIGVEITRLLSKKGLQKSFRYRLTLFIVYYMLLPSPPGFSAIILVSVDLKEEGLKWIFLARCRDIMQWKIANHRCFRKMKTETLKYCQLSENLCQLFEDLKIEMHKMKNVKIFLVKRTPSKRFKNFSTTDESFWEGEGIHIQMFGRGRGHCHIWNENQIRHVPTFLLIIHVIMTHAIVWLHIKVDWL